MKTIITIGRQFGSGGKEIGIRVAKELGIPFYDKELLQEAAKKSGLCEKIFENFDERPKSLLYSIAMDSYMFALPGTGAGDSLEQQVYLATFDTIRQIAAQGPCVMIGRCAVWIPVSSSASRRRASSRTASAWRSSPSSSTFLLSFLP